MGGCVSPIRGCASLPPALPGPCPLTLRRGVVVDDEYVVARGSGKMRGSPTFPDAEWDGRRQKLIETILGENDEKEAAHVSEAMAPRVAMHSIFKHLHLDPDGGLVNLGDAKQGQVSKAKTLWRGPLHSLMALVFLLRIVLNVGKVSHFAGMHSVALFLLEGHAMYLSEKYRSVTYAHILGANSHISELIVVVSAIEGTAMVLFLCIVLWNLLKACSTSGLPRYIGLASIFWTDLPRVANLSAMYAISYVHPNLLVKNARTYRLREKACRALLEAFFRGRLDGHANEEVAVQVGKIIFSKANLDRKAEEEISQQREMQVGLTSSPRGTDLHHDASRFIDFGPVACWKALREDFGSLGVLAREELLESFGVDHRVLDRTGRLACVNLLEYCCFGLVVLSCFLIGFAGLVVKLAEGAITITSATESSHSKIFWIAAFLNQLMSVLTIKELLIWRVEAFIFGGCDAVITAEEQYVIRTYKGHLLQTIWASNAFDLNNKVVLSLNLEDDDLQQLILEEDIRAKQQVIEAVKQYLKKAA